METKIVPSEAEQNQLVDEWYARRPVKPARPKPVEPHTSGPIFGIGNPLALLGFCIGFCLFILGLVSRPVDSTLTSIGFTAMLVLPFLIPIVYIVGGFIIEEVEGHHYNVTLERSGWPEYELAYQAWLDEGNPFYEWWYLNKHVDKMLRKASEDP